jgi:hypothetical protein
MSDHFDEQPDGDPHGECAVEIHRLTAQSDELLAALKLILPLAKGYAHQHRVGSNQAYCDQADAAIAKAVGQPFTP